MDTGSCSALRATVLRAAFAAHLGLGGRGWRCATGDLLRKGEKLFALLDGILLQTREGVGGLPSDRERHCGKTQLWNRSRGSNQSCPGLEPRSSRLVRVIVCSRNRASSGSPVGMTRNDQGEVDEQGDRNTKRSWNEYLLCVTCSMLGSS